MSQQLSKKVRIIVEFTATDTGQNSRHAVPMLPTQTVADLIREISRRRGTTRHMSLTLSDESILSEEDAIEDVIQPGEVVHAHYDDVPPISPNAGNTAVSKSLNTQSQIYPSNLQTHSASPSTSPSSPTTSETAHSPSTSTQPYIPPGRRASQKIATSPGPPSYAIACSTSSVASIPYTNAEVSILSSPGRADQNGSWRRGPQRAPPLQLAPLIKRIRIALLTPESAYNGGEREPLKKLAFDGSAVSVDLTMDTVRREVARTLGWLDSGYSSSPTQDPESHRTMPRGICSCTVANQILSQGRFEQFHCVNEIDGTRCHDPSCRLSHEVIASGILGRDPADLECKICGELFGFPCTKCISEHPDEKRFSHCPLVQNAGCKHIFHAHCYFSRSSVVHACPAGCTAAQFPAEAIPFNMKPPHVVVVHSGSVIEYISLPERECRRAALNGLITLADTEIVQLLGAKLPNLGAGLTVRIFGRKNTGLITFRHSTIVSICCQSRHAEADGIVRLNMNGPLPASQATPSNLDLHTAASPIFNESPSATIKDLGLDEKVPDGGEITLYVVKKTSVQKKSDVAEVRVGKAAVYSYHAAWEPLNHQTERGMAAFLSSLLVFAHYLSVNEPNADNSNTCIQNRILHHLLGLTRFPPAVRALYILSLNGSLTSEESRALSETFYHLCLNVTHPLVTKGDISRTFEGVRLLFGIILERSKGPYTLSTMDNIVSSTVPFKCVSLVCEVSGEPLRDPVIQDGQIVERSIAQLRCDGRSLFNPQLEDMEITPPPTFLPCLLRTAGFRASRLIVLDENIEIPPVLSRRLCPGSLTAGLNLANVELQMHAPLTLKQQVVTPALTLDESGFNAVYISRGGPCAPADEDVILLRPTRGGETGVDVNVIAARLEPIIEKRKIDGDWDIDSFVGPRADRVDTREVEEAVVIALDLSRSMKKKFNTDEEDDDVDVDQQIARKIKELFQHRDPSRASVISAVKIFIETLDCIPSIARYIFRGEEQVSSWFWSTDPYTARRKERAIEMLEELATVFGRVHHQTLQGSRFDNARMVAWENFYTLVKESPFTALNELAEQLVSVSLRQSEGITNSTQRLLDPLSGKPINDLVLGEDGHSHDRSSLVAWKTEFNTWPLNPTIRFSSNPSMLQTNFRTRGESLLMQGNSNPRYPRYLIELSQGRGSCQQYVALSGSNSVLSVLIDNWVFNNIKPSKTQLWQGLRDCGDGMMIGTPISPLIPFSQLTQATKTIDGHNITLLRLQRYPWHYMPAGAEEQRIESRSMSRFDIVRQSFEAFINKSEAFDHPVAIGLVTFGKDVREVQKITLLKEQFRSSLWSVKPNGDTPLFDSLALAHSMLQDFHREHPSSRLRIICLTDGYDVGSKTVQHTLTAKLQESRVVVDSIAVQTGGSLNMVHPISVATGGYSFTVDTLENALNIVELETVLCSKDRLVRPRQPRVRGAFDLARYQDTNYYPMDIVTAEECPGRQPHTRLNEPLMSAQRAAARRVPPSSTDRHKRLMQEVRDVVNSPHPAFDVYVGDDLAFWKIVIEGPQGSPYAGGTFLAYVDFGDNYPRVAPEIRLVTRILHPNINRHGKVCHAALDKSWLVDMTMSIIFQIIYGMLLTPDVDNPLDLHATMEYNDDTGQHALKVHNMVQRFASKTRDQWRRELET